MIIETAHGGSAWRVRERRSHPRLSLACWGYLAFLVGVGIVMHELGDRWWPASLLLFGPRWPLACPLLLLLPWALAARNWRSAGALAGAAVALLVPVLGFRVSIPGARSERADLRLLSCNIHRQHLDAAKLAAFIAAERPDIVALQGWSDMHQEALFGESGWEIRRDGELLLASRFPLGDVQALEISDPDPDVPAGERGSAALYEVKLPQGAIHLVSLHLASPHAGLNSLASDRGAKLADNIERRWRESEKLGEFLERVQGTLLLAGDFNTVSESPLFRERWAGFEDAFSECGTGLGYTYLINHTQLRIDHILADASCGFVRCRVGPDVNAAHRPLVADIEFR